MSPQSMLLYLTFSIESRCRVNFFVEPTSSSAPRFASESYVGFQLRKSSGMAINLLCPAQAFPAPLFRWITLDSHTLFEARGGGRFCSNAFCINSNSIAPLLCCDAEPTSSSAPRFASESYGFVLRKSSGMAFNLLCPAQAFPAPLFR
jgi:hypothetical protein